MQPVPEPGRASRHLDEVEISDRRWLLVAFAVFAATLVLLFGAHMVYRATGPHPQVTVFVRRVKGLAHKFLPGWRRHRADPA